MIDMLTGLNLPHEAERQEAFILIKELYGTAWWFERGFDKLDGKQALYRAKAIEDTYYDYMRS